MKTIVVKAEHEYTVVIGKPWGEALVPLLGNRARVAGIV
jgi:hypothetical protein